jgi:predicted dithiol-disulfide oxidoreductase (DUF899 family)
MDKFIKVIKGNDRDREKSWEWRNTCKEHKIPYVVILIAGDKISIGASIIHLTSLPGEKMEVNTAAIETELKEIYQQYSENVKGYWNFNDLYHLLDFVPETYAFEICDKVYNILKSHISFKPVS